MHKRRMRVAVGTVILGLTVGLMLAVGMTVAVAGMGPLPNPLPKESKAVEKDGLSLTVRLPRTDWRADEPLEFTNGQKAAPPHERPGPGYREDGFGKKGGGA